MKLTIAQRLDRETKKICREFPDANPVFVRRALEEILRIDAEKAIASALGMDSAGKARDNGPQTRD